MNALFNRNLNARRIGGSPAAAALPAGLTRAALTCTGATPPGLPWIGVARFAALGLAVFGLALADASPGMAQAQIGQPGGMVGATRSPVNAPVKPQVAAPPVLPGTKVAPEAALPSMPSADMSPTDALFDAINRGDTAGARDASNRGADLNARNVLGLTPLELSVDLGRNNISFLLLSLREGDSTSRAMSRRGVSQGDADSAGIDPAAAAFGAAASPRVVRRARVSSPPPPDGSAAEVPRYASGNGGAPIPSAGFLGFDERRSAR